MRRVLPACLLSVLLIGACTSKAVPTEVPADGSEEPTSTSVPADSPPEAAPIGPAEEPMIRQLGANLDLQESDITIVRSEETEFGDACLGVTMEGVTCAQVATPGRIIVLKAKGVEYEYHTSQDGSRVQPATLALVWKREGGIAGFCDILTVFRTGEVFTTNCKSNAEGRRGLFAELLSAKEKQQFNNWIAGFGEVKLDASDPQGVADRMVVTLEFFGTGSEQPSDSDQQALFNFAQELYQKLSQ